MDYVYTNLEKPFRNYYTLGPTFMQPSKPFHLFTIKRTCLSKLHGAGMDPFRINEFPDKPDLLLFNV